MKTVYYRYGRQKRIIEEKRGYEYLHNYFGIKVDHSKAIENGCLIITNDMDNKRIRICKSPNGLK
jgi:hypothetical protein